MHYTLRHSIPPFLGLLLLLPMGPATAGVIFDNGALDGGAQHSDFGVTNPQQLADDFSLSTGSNTVTDIHWWGAYDFNNLSADDFTIRIFANDGGGAPETSASILDSSAGSNVNRTNTGDSTTIGWNIYSYSVDITPLTLAAGTTYWLSVVNNTTSGWNWATSNADTGDAYVRSNDANPWEPYPFGNGIELAFQLTNDNLSVPAPGTLALLLPGLMLLARRRRLTA